METSKKFLDENGLTTLWNQIEDNFISTDDIDSTLTVSGQTADAKAVGDAISSLSEENAELKKNIDGLSNNLLTYNKALALRELLKCVAYDGNSKYAEAYALFISEWGLTDELLSISAVINGKTAYIGTNAKDLDITVTGHFSDGRVLVLQGWEIYGTVEEGDNSFIIEYGQFTTTVSVTGEGYSLPSGYTICSSVNNNGSNYILCNDIRMKAGTDKFVVDFKVNDGAKNDTMIFGGFTDSGVGRIGVAWTNGYAYFNGANKWFSKVEGFELQTNRRVAFTLDTKNGIAKMLDAEFMFSTATFTGANLCIFGYCNQINLLVQQITSATLYGFKMYRHDILIADMVPCLRNSDNAVGVYDVIGNTFYKFSGSGTPSYEVVE